MVQLIIVARCKPLRHRLNLLRSPGPIARADSRARIAVIALLYVGVLSSSGGVINNQAARGAFLVMTEDEQP